MKPKRPDSSDVPANAAGNSAPTVAALGGVVLFALLLRLIWPLSDPPDRLTWSNGEIMDPASIVHAARNFTLFGEWVRDSSKDLIFYPLLNLMTAAAFKIFGVKRLVIQSLSALFGAATVWATAWAVSRMEGKPRGTVVALLVATCFWVAMMSRAPVAENLVVALLMVAAGFSLGQSKRDHLLGGFFLGIAAFFGKIHGLVSLPGIAFILFRRSGTAGLIEFAKGFAIAFALWCASVAIPGRDAIFDQLHQAKKLYGNSPWQKSLLETVAAPLRALRNSWFFIRFWAPCVVGGWYIFSTMAHGPTFERRLKSGAALFPLWCAAGWASLSYLSYQAPRYFILLAVPIVVCAGLQIEEWRSGKAPRLLEFREWRGRLVALLWFTFLGFGLVEGFTHGCSLIEERLYLNSAEAGLNFVSATRGVTDAVQEFPKACLAGTCLALAAWFVLFVVQRLAPAKPRPASSSASSARFAAGVLAALLAFEALQWVDWVGHRSEALEEARASLEGIVGENAVVMGGFAPALVLESKNTAIPMIGVPEPDVFEKYGVTHFVLGEPGNLAALRDGIPGFAERLVPLQGWPIRTRHLRRISLFRVLPLEGDATSSYVPTDFERAVERLNADDVATADSLLVQHAALLGEGRSIPDIAVLRAECALKLGRDAEARALLEEALRLRPELPLELYNLGILEERAGNRTRACELWKRGVRADPYDKNLSAAYQSCSIPAP